RPTSRWSAFMRRSRGRWRVRRVVWRRSWARSRFRTPSWTRMRTGSRGGCGGWGAGRTCWSGGGGGRRSGGGRGCWGLLRWGACGGGVEGGWARDGLWFRIEDPGMRVTVGDRGGEGGLPATSAHLVPVDREWAGLSALPGDDPGFAVQPSDLAYVIYTSGST